VRIKAVLRAIVKAIVMTTGLMSFAVLLIACGDAPAREPPDSPSAAPPATPPPITLVANLDQAPVEWGEVAFLPGGDGLDEIGLDPCFHCEAVVPAALAVAPDGTYWIADSYKGRIAHFAEDGSFIEAIPTERGPADLAFVGERLYVLFEEGGRTIAAVESGALGEPVMMTAAGQPLHVLAFVGYQDQLLAWFTDAQETLGRFWAMGAIDPATGEVTPALGIQVSGDLFMDLVPLLETRPLSYEVRWSEAGRLIRRQQIRFQLVRDSRPVRTTVGDTYIRTSTPTGFATLVSIGDGQGLPVGVWYAEFPTNGGQPTFEPLQNDGFIGDAIRYVAIGPDGRIYWMRLQGDGLHIYRR
jgi:hypothetical protein